MKNTEPSIPDGCPRARVSDVTPQVEVLLVLLGARGPLSESGIRAGLEIKDQASGRCLSLETALEAGLIEVAGNGRPKGQGRRYGLTTSGMEVTGRILATPPRLPPAEWAAIRRFVASSRPL